MGLWAGVSVVTLIELGEAFLAFTCICCLRRKVHGDP